MAYCSACGKQLPPNAKFCTACGAAVESEQSYQNQNQGYQSQGYRPQGYQPQGYQSQGYQPQGGAQTMPLKWHKFLTRFGLWVGVLALLCTGISYFTGGVYATSGLTAGQVYAYYGASLHTVDVFYGLCCLALAGLTAWCCVGLIKFRSKAPQRLYMLMAANGLVGVLYPIFVAIVTGYDVEFASIVSTLVGVAVSFAINYTYYQKRLSLFQN